MLKKILIALGVFTLLLAAAFITIALVYEKQVKKIIVGEINKQLISPVQVGDIEFSLIKNFPKASLSFYNVKAQSVYQGMDNNHCPKNILTAKEISLQFNIKDVFNGNYTINKVNLKGINLNVFIDALNNDNYHCWRSDTASNSAEVKFKMNQIDINNFDVTYNDLQKELNFDLLFNDGLMQGEVFANDFALIIQSKLTIKGFEYEKHKYLTNKKLVLNFGLLKQNEVVSFNNASAALEKLTLNLSGSFGRDDINFEAKGNKLDIQSFISLLPEHLSQKFAEYNSQGLFAFHLKVKGNQKQPAIRASFEIVNATLGQNASKVELRKLNLKGYYSNGRSQNMQTSGLYVNTFNASLNKSPIEGKFSIVDFTEPFIDGNIKASFKLNELKEILQLDTFNLLEGNADLVLRISCPIAQLKQKDITKAKQGELAGSLQLKNGSFIFKNDVMKYENIEANLYADDNYILVKNLSFMHGKSEIELQGELSNFQALLNNNQEKAVLRAYLNSSNFELEDWLPKHQAKADNSRKSDEIYLNSIDLKLKTKIERFKFDNFRASNLSSNIYFKEKQFRFDSLKFNSMDGKATANGAIYLQANGGFDLKCDAKLSKISINKLFEQLNNFGQKTLTDKHIAGKLSAEIVYKSSWSDMNTIIPESILADATVLITDGQLNNFTPLNKLSKFVAVSELGHIKFNELANNISISNKKIYVPQFQIKSSAMNLYCSGTHDFNNNIDYHFKVTLNELLSKKRKREVPKNNDFDEIEESEDGKTTLFISMTGNIDNPKIKFDKKELKQFVKDEIKSEKQAVKQLLKDEFGFFKKDKSLNQKEEIKGAKQKDFEIEWEEDPKLSPKETNQTTQKKSNKIVGGENKPEKKVEKSKEKVKPQKEENSDDFL